MLSMINEGYKRIPEVCEDTDVFVLLVHHFHESNLLNTELPIDVLQCNVHCQETATKAIYISLTIKSCHKKQNKRNFSSLLAAHALSGCDTVRCLECTELGRKRDYNF